MSLRTSAASFAALAALWISTCELSAQGPSQEPPGMAVQRALAAHGGRAALGEVTDGVFEGTITYFGSDGPKSTFPLTLLRKGKQQVQRIVRQPAADVRLGSDGVRTWHSLGDKFASFAQGDGLNFIESQTARSVRALLEHEVEGLTLSDAGRSGNARVIEAEDRQGRKTRYSIDPSSIVTAVEFVKGEGRDAFSGRSVPLTDRYVFSDFRRVRGVLTAFKIERFIGGLKREEMIFTSVSYNASVKDDAFKP